MRPVPALPVAPDQPLVLKPGSYHMMLFGLRQPLKEGDHLPVTLHFAGAGSVAVTAVVVKAGGAGPSGQQGMMMDHHETKN
jgi:copper(I)-binding protein